MTQKQAIFYARANELELLAGQTRSGEPFRDLSDYADLHSIAVIAEYSDAATDLSEAKPGFSALLEMLRQQQRGSTVVLITDTERLARDLQIHKMMKQQIEEVGGELIVTGFEPCTVFLNGLPAGTAHD